MSTVTQTGVYYGWAQVSPISADGQRVLSEADSVVLTMVMSLGYNPFYKNQQLTAVSSRFWALQLVIQGHYRRSILCMTLDLISTGMP